RVPFRAYLAGSVEDVFSNRIEDARSLKHPRSPVDSIRPVPFSSCRPPRKSGSSHSTACQPTGMFHFTDAVLSPKSIFASSDRTLPRSGTSLFPVHLLSLYLVPSYSSTQTPDGGA